MQHIGLSFVSEDVVLPEANRPTCTAILYNILVPWEAIISKGTADGVFTIFP